MAASVGPTRTSRRFFIRTRITSARDGGVVVGYYHFAKDADEVGDCRPPEREAHALAQGAKLHPQYAAEFAGGAFSVAWQRIPVQPRRLGRVDRGRPREVYPVLNEPDGPFYLAGEHLTYLGGWMAGAFESAKAVVTSLKERAAQTS